MAAFDVLVIRHVVAQVPHLRHHLAGVPWVYAIVAGGSGHQQRRIVGVGLHVVVGRVGLQEAPLVGIVRVAVFGHPAGPGQEPVVAPHVEQRHLRGDGAEQVRAHGEHGAHQEAAVAAAENAELGGIRDVASNQVFGHGDEVLEGARTILLQRRLVPGRAELAAAADVGQRVDAAAFEPGDADAGGIARQLRDLEAAVAVQQRRLRLRLASLAGPRDLEVGNARAVGGGRPMLRDGEALGIEVVRLLLEHLRSFAHRA